MELLDRREAHERPGVPFAQPAVGDRGLDPLVELQEAERVGDRRPGSTDLPGDVLLGQPELLVELPEGVRFLDRVEVLALDVLDECELELLAIGELADHRGNSLESGEASGLDAALTGDDPVAVERLGDEDRLEDAVVGDARSERLEVGVLDVAPGLVRVDPDLAERDLAGAVRRVVA